MKIFIDLGAYMGDSIKQFMERPDGLEFEIYAFEPNISLFPKLHEAINSFPNVALVDSGAAWIKDEVRAFAVDPTDTPMGSTLMSGKQHIWSISPKDQIHCFDFSEWIKQFKDDYVIVKMDIEGAEFPVLRKMLDDGTAELMNELWVEFHQNKVQEYTTQDANDIVRLIIQAGVEVKLWH